MRIIDADALKEALTKACNTFEAFGIDTTIERVMISCIDNAPTIEVKDTLSKPSDDNGSYHLSCNHCGKDWWSKDPFVPRCPFCGNEEYWW